jgi:hypothetical protein
MEYDLIRLFEHPVYLGNYIASAIVTFAEAGSSQRVIPVEWRRSAGEPLNELELTLKWDVGALRSINPLIDRELETLRERDENRGRRTELAAIAVAVAVMSHVEPETKFTTIADIGSRHDYYLNETQDEMIEIAGRWEGGLASLFDEKRAQSDLNPALRKRWVSVTIAQKSPRNRTEGLHT